VRFDAGRKAAARWPLLFSEAVRTHLYIDGFNLYYGCLKGSFLKWLDPVRMAALLLPGHTITATHYFSANVSARPGDPDQPIRQQTYLRALRTLPNFTIHLGYFLGHAVRMSLAHPPPGGPTTAVVWRTDEKGSDVNLATQILVDGFDDAYECAVLVTNDSDLLAPISVVRRRLGKRVGLLNPQQRPARTLLTEVDFYKKIRCGVLAASQFAPTLTDAIGTFSKPATW
jgi:uncharacterized LabA/DUF88 family protein